MKREYQICTRCVMDTTDTEITFDANGVCNHCTNAINQLEKISFKNERERENKLAEIVALIKKSGKGRNYDCIIGLSGGVDSSYMAYVVVRQLGLKPLAVHVDNGWNSELAVQNIENIVKKLNIDLYTHVIDWEEFKDLQRAYLKASVIDLEVLSDNAIVITIHKLMKKYGIRYFLIGYNYQSESIMPSSWLYSPKYDGLNIKSIYRKFGKGKKLRTFPVLSLFGYINYRFFNKTIPANLLDLISYNKQEAIKTLQNELNWRDYGGKHYESKITHFYQSYILPEKFRIDKRKAHLSSLIVSGQITRQVAINKLEEPLFKQEQVLEEKAYFIKKLELSEEEFEALMRNPIKSHYDYPSYNKIFTQIINYKNKLMRFQ